MINVRPATISPSQFKRIMAKKGLGAGAETYSIELVHQLLGVPMDDYTNFAMQWGKDHEPKAIRAYEKKKLVEVERNVRQYHPKYDFISGEADGLIGKHGIIEVKSPNSANHVRNLIYGSQLEDYKYQIQGYLWIFEREWCDFISFDPRFPKIEHQLSVHSVERDEEIISLLERRCLEFWEDLVLPKMEIIESL